MPSCSKIAAKLYLWSKTSNPRSLLEIYNREVQYFTVGAVYLKINKICFSCDVYHTIALQYVSCLAAVLAQLAWIKQNTRTTIYHRVSIILSLRRDHQWALAAGLRDI